MLHFLCNWTKVCLELCILCAAAHKQGLGTHVVSLGVIRCHILRCVFIPVAKVISASSVSPFPSGGAGRSSDW
jgi:hypothetical protein